MPTGRAALAPRNPRSCTSPDAPDSPRWRCPARGPRGAERRSGRGRDRLGPALSGADDPAQLNYVAKINVGEQTACTGTLVDPQWVLSAATCFRRGRQTPRRQPAITTTVTIGRTDLTQTNGSVQQAIALVPHADRDLVLVRLATRITDPAIKPVPLATTPAADNEQLTVAGFGRTKTEWVPSKLHTGTFTVASTTNTTVDLNGSGTATVCKGPLSRRRRFRRGRQRVNHR